MIYLIAILMFFPVSKNERTLLEELLTKMQTLDNIEPIYDIIEKHGLTYYIPISAPILGQYTISSNYGNRRHPISGKLKFHSGVDFASPIATTIHATADGIVKYAGRNGGYGKCIILEHAFGFTTLYAHLSAYYVLENEIVKQGKVIGFVGSSGMSTGNHLHYEIRKNNKPINPMPWRK